MRRWRSCKKQRPGTAAIMLHLPIVFYANILKRNDK
jgi:hypothetical protein